MAVEANNEKYLRAPRTKGSESLVRKGAGRGRIASETQMEKGVLRLPVIRGFNKKKMGPARIF